MANVQFFAPKKEGSVFDPARDAEIRRRRKMAEAMMKAGEQPNSTEMVSGMAVKQSPLGALAKALQQGVAGYQEGKADELDTEAQKKRNEMMAQAIRSSQQDPQAGIDMLAGGDPAMQEMAWKMGQGNIEHERAKEIAQLRAKAISGGGGGGVVANNAKRMLELQQVAMDESSSPEEKSLAEDELNYMIMAGKYLDRGAKIGFGNDAVLGQDIPPTPMQGQMAPPPINAMEQAGTMPQGQVDPAMMAVLNNTLRQTPTQNTAPQIAQPINGQAYSNAILGRPTVSPMQGYGEAVGSIAANKKRAETQAQKDVDLVMNPKITAEEERQKNISALEKTRLTKTQENATALLGQKATSDTIKGLINQGALGNTPSDRIQMVAHKYGIQSPESRNTAQIMKLGNQLVLSRGSLGTGVSVADAERYDKAAGDFTNAQSNEERLEYIAIMDGIREQALTSADAEMSSYASGKGIPPLSGGQKPQGKIMTDANGNKAMVYPDGTFEEIK